MYDQVFFSFFCLRCRRLVIGSWDVGATEAVSRAPPAAASASAVMEEELILVLWLLLLLLLVVEIAVAMDSTNNNW
jgi:hypothetical protein